jgi:hypothetical protein
MKNNYYFIKYEYQGVIYQENIKLEKSYLGDNSRNRILQMLDGGKLILMKKTTKFNYENGQY